jgi:hypothetical protein
MIVRPVLLIAVVLSSLTAPLAAQELPPATSPLPAREPLPSHTPTPKVEVFFGYTAVNFLGEPKPGPIFMQGVGRGWGIRAFDWNINDRVAFVVGTLGFGSSSIGTRYSFLVGPRARFRPQHRVSPFAQLLVGTCREASFDVESGQFVNIATRLQTAISAGVDVRLSRWIAWRAVQLEARSVVGNAHPLHRLVASSGIVIRFGTKK